MDGKTISLAAVASALNIDAGELNKFAKEGEVDVAQDVFEQKVADHLKTTFTGTIDRTKTGSWDDGFKAAQRKTLTEKERDLKTKYPGLEGTNLDELFDSAYKHGGNTDWRKDPAVQGELQKLGGQIQTLTQDLEKERQTSSQKVSLMKLEGMIPTILKDKFTIPTEAKTATKRQTLLMAEVLQGGKVEIRDVDGVLVPWNVETNKQVQNGVYQNISLDELVLAAAADLYDPFKGSGHSGPGNHEEAPKGGGGVSGDLGTILTWDDVYKYKNQISVTDKDGKTKLAALAVHVEKLKASGKLK